MSGYPTEILLALRVLDNGDGDSLSRRQLRELRALGLAERRWWWHRLTSAGGKALDDAFFAALLAAGAGGGDKA